MFTPKDYVFSFDLKSGYHHVDIFPEHWQYLGFSWGKVEELDIIHSQSSPLAYPQHVMYLLILIRPLI